MSRQFHPGFGSQQMNNGNADWGSFSSQPFSAFPSTPMPLPIPVGQNVGQNQAFGATYTDTPPYSSPNTAFRPATPKYIPSQLKGRDRWIIGGSIGGLVVILGILFIIGQTVLKSSTSVTLYQASIQNVTQYVGGGGIVCPQQQYVLSYPETEQAVDVLVKAGNTVVPNQPLIKLDATQINIQIKQASDDVAAAQAYLNAVSSGGSSGAIAQAQQQYAIAKNRYSALVSQTASLTLHNGNLVSPMSGVVTQINVNTGEVFASDVPLLTIMDESTVIVHVKVPLANLGQVHTGQTAIVTPSALPNVNLTGQVSSIIPQADPQTDTFEVWVSVQNPAANLLPGMSAFVRIQSSGRAVIVPRLAVLDSDRDSSVFVEHNQHVYLQHVHVSGRSADTIFVDAGLSGHDYVVLTGLYQLHDGQQVRVNGIEK